MKAINPYYHGSSKTERHIKTISEIIAEPLTGTGQIWIHYLQTCTYVYNSFANPALNDFS